MRSYSTLGRTFFHQFRNSAVWKIITSVQRLQKDFHSTSTDAVVQAFTNLDAIDQQCLDRADPNQSITIAELPTYSMAMRTLRRYCEGVEVWNLLYRQRIMLKEQGIAELIQDASQRHARTILDKLSSLHPSGRKETPQASRDWLEKLTLTILDSIYCGIQLRLKACNFLVDCKDLQISYDESPMDFRRRKNLPLAQVKNATCEYIARTLQSWFDMPIPFISQARALFINVLVSTAGTGSLLMPHIWPVYTQTPSWFFSVEAARVEDISENQHVVFEERYMADFVQEIMTSSRLRISQNDLSLLQDEFKKLHKAADQHVEKLISHQLKPRRLQQMISRIHATETGINFDHTFLICF